MRRTRRKSACWEHRRLLYDCDKAPGSKGRKSVLGKVRKSMNHYARSVIKALKPHRTNQPLIQSQRGLEEV